MSKKQTSIDFLIEEVKKQHPLWRDIFIKAKAMHKEEIIKAAIYDPFLGDLPKQVGEQYYEDEFVVNQE